MTHCAIVNPDSHGSTPTPDDQHVLTGKWITDWLREPRATAVFDRNERFEALLLPSDIPSEMLDALIRAAGAKSLYLTRQGWALVAPVAYMRQLVRAHRSSPDDAVNTPASGLADEQSDALETEQSQWQDDATSPPANARKMRRPTAWLLVDAAAAKKKFEAIEELRSAESSVRRQRDMLEALAKRPYRFLPRATRSHLHALTDLRDRFPNCIEPLLYVKRCLQLQVRLRAALRIPPIGLLGEPGCGKTEFARELGRLLKMRVVLRSCADLTANFVLTGGSASWRDSQPGLIARELISLPDGESALFLMDELDKAYGSDRFATSTALLGCLEDRTAQSFVDEFIDLPMDIRPLSWIFTFNDAYKVDPAMLSRMRVFQIRPPTMNQMPAVIHSIEAQLLFDKPLLKRAFLPLDDAVIAELRGHAPRELKRIIEDAMALCVEEGGSDRRLAVASRHVRAALAGAVPARPTIGFLSAGAR